MLPVRYADAVRVRPHKAKVAGLGPHIDAGNLSLGEIAELTCVI